MDTADPNAFTPRTECIEKKGCQNPRAEVKSKDGPRGATKVTKRQPKNGKKTRTIRDAEKEEPLTPESEGPRQTTQRSPWSIRTAEEKANTLGARDERGADTVHNNQNNRRQKTKRKEGQSPVPSARL